MNYLTHLYLSDPTPECMLGNLMGDFVKGPLDGTYSSLICRGISMHRKVDLFSYDHPTIKLTKSRLHNSHRHCKGIMVDIFYDHFLAKNWALYHSTPLEEFARNVYATLEKYKNILPGGLGKIAPRMISNNWLVSYRNIETIEVVLERLSKRLSRPNTMYKGITDLKAHYPEMEKDFHSFLPEAKKFISRLKLDA